ncbi:MAG: hypothetical protein HYT16_01080 [DPANN group archaeon]|nr:hypothetical protein [DPANN group archaeon]
MRKEIIEQLVRSDQLRKRFPDKEKIKSILESAETNMRIVKGVLPTEDSATLIFRETYESVRQLGDAKWWLLGYEPRNHEVSLEILKDMDIKERTKLNHVMRFKSIRNDANYRGFKISLVLAKEILEFWDLCAADIISELLKELKTNTL